MNKALRSAQYVGNIHLHAINWHFRVYLMLGDTSENIEKDNLFKSLEHKIKLIDDQYLSKEFIYLRSGFILAHYGRRGVTYSFWHWADWEGTWEYFCQAWYCYGRDIEGMTSLDRTEPILCQHEIDLVMKEGLLFRNIALQHTSNEEIINCYRGFTPN